MPEEKNENVGRQGLAAFEREWKNYQSLSPEEKRVVKREVGILREAKSGIGFYDYVKEQMMNESDKEVCAKNIRDQLMKDPRYLVNAVTDRNGRRALSIVTDDVQGEGDPTLSTIRYAMRKEEKEYRSLNEQIFEQNFQKYSEDFKKEVEKQGKHQVDRVYYVRHDLPGFTQEKEKFYEIRAEISDLKKYETMKGEIRKTPVNKKDVRVGVFDRARGDFVPEDYMFRRDKPLEKTFVDYVAEDIVNLGIAAIARATGRILIEGGKRVADGIAKRLAKELTKEGSSISGEITEKVVPRVIARAAMKGEAKEVSSAGGEIMGKGGGRAGSRVRGPVDARASTEHLPRVRQPNAELARALRRERASGRIDERASTDHLPEVRGPPGRPPPGGGPPSATPPGGRGPPTGQFLPYSERTIQILGRDVADTAARIGVTEEQLTGVGTTMGEIELSEARGIVRTNWWIANLWREGEGELLTTRTVEAARQSLRRDIQNTCSLGENTARRLIEYGYNPYSISRWIDEHAAKGLTMDQIRQRATNELRLMDFYRDHLMGGSVERARATLSPLHSAHGDVSANIRTEIYGRLIDRFKRQMNVERPADIEASVWNALPRPLKREIAWDALPMETKAQIRAGIAERAERVTDRLVRRLLGPAAGAGALSPSLFPEKTTPQSDSGKNARALSVDKVKELLSFGYRPKDISRFINKNDGAGYTNIGSALESQVELLNHLKNDLCVGSIGKARSALEKADFNIAKALMNMKYAQLKSERSLTDSSRSISDLLGAAADAAEFARNLRDNVLKKNLGDKTDTSRLTDLTSDRPAQPPERPGSPLRIRDIQPQRDLSDRGERNKRRFA